MTDRERTLAAAAALAACIGCQGSVPERAGSANRASGGWTAAFPSATAVAEGAAGPRDATRAGPAAQVVHAPGPRPSPYTDCRHAAVASSCDADWCEIPSGCFVMGSPDDEWYRSLNGEPRRTVTLTHAFRIGRHEVTQRDWVAQGLPNPSGKMADGTGDCAEPDCPVGNVTWTEALAFANLLSKAHDPPLAPCYELTNCQKELGSGMSCGGFKTTAATVYDCKGFRLPTDAEWEYAARAGTWTAFYDGDITVYDRLDCLPDPNLERVAWYCFDSKGSTHPVGGLEPNAWGLYDMLGNADEWVNDHDFGTPPVPPKDPGATLQVEVPRARRGGAFNSQAIGCRTAARVPGSFWARGPGLGFRLVQTR